MLEAAFRRAGVHGVAPSSGMLLQVTRLPHRMLEWSHGWIQPTGLPACRRGSFYGRLDRRLVSEPAAHRLDRRRVRHSGDQVVHADAAGNSLRCGLPGGRSDRARGRCVPGVWMGSGVLKPTPELTFTIDCFGKSRNRATTASLQSTSIRPHLPAATFAGGAWHCRVDPSARHFPVQAAGLGHRSDTGEVRSAPENTGSVNLGSSGARCSR